MKTTNFDSCIGHDSTRQLLERLIQSPKRPHALLFSGPPGVGKHTFARALARGLLLGTTSSSRSVETHPDFHAVQLEEGKKDIPVQAIRALRSDLQLKPYEASIKIAIIDNAERMSIAACNALLMTLEEPTEHTQLILVSSAAHRLPATILSRCSLVNFGFLKQEEIQLLVEKLVHVAGADNKLVPSLVASTDGTLGPLFLERYIEQNSMQIADREGLQTHLETLAERVAEMRNALEQFITGEPTSAASRAVSLASTFTQDDEFVDVAWTELRLAISRQLRGAPSSQTSRWAEIMEKLLRSQRLVNERNANAALQLSSVLLDMVAR